MPVARPLPYRSVSVYRSGSRRPPWAPPTAVAVRSRKQCPSRAAARVTGARQSVKGTHAMGATWRDAARKIHPSFEAWAPCGHEEYDARDSRTSKSNMQDTRVLASSRTRRAWPTRSDDTAKWTRLNIHRQTYVGLPAAEILTSVPSARRSFRVPPIILPRQKKRAYHQVSGRPLTLPVYASPHLTIQHPPTIPLRRALFEHSRRLLANPSPSASPRHRFHYAELGTVCTL